MARGRHLAVPRRQGHDLGRRRARAVRDSLARRTRRAGEQRDRRHDRPVADAGGRGGRARCGRKLKKGASIGGSSYKVHLDGFDQTALFTGQSDKSARNFVFYYDETVLTAIRYQQFKVSFSAKVGGHWDDPLLSLGRPLITNLLMDPFERQVGDVNRQYAEHKAWVLTPILGIVEQHLASFQEFPVRQVGLCAQMGKTIEGIQSQILKMQQAQ